MKRCIGYAAIGLGSIGLTACLAGLIVIWVLRPQVLRSAAELLDTADGGLKVVVEKATRADELVTAIRAGVEPIAGKIRKLADRKERTPAEERELRQMEENLAERLRQVDAIAEAAETAVTFLRQTSRIARSLPLAASRSAPQEDVRDSSDTLSRLATKLRDLRVILAKVRGDKNVKKEIVAGVVGVTRDVDDNLRAVDSNLKAVRQRAVEWRTQVAELRSTVPAWTNWSAIIGSALLVWLGLGQFALSRWGWGRICATPRA